MPRCSWPSARLPLPAAIFHSFLVFIDETLIDQVATIVRIPCVLGFILSWLTRPKKLKAELTIVRKERIAAGLQIFVSRMLSRLHPDLDFHRDNPTMVRSILASIARTSSNHIGYLVQGLDENSELDVSFDMGKDQVRVVILLLRTNLTAGDCSTI